MAAVAEALSKISTRQLYRDLLRVAHRVGQINNNEEALVAGVRDTFRKHRNEIDPVRIQNHREAAIRALSNYMVTEAQRLATEARNRGETLDLGEEFEEGSDEKR